MTPLEQHNDLPLAVRKRLDYFPQLLTRLANAPIWDTHETLDAALAEYKAGEEDLSQGRKFIGRLGHYLAATPMEASRRERIEDWAFWAKDKENKFLNDLEIPEWKEVVTEADRAPLEHRLYTFTTTGRRIDRLDRDLDKDGENAANTERHIAQIEKRLAELNAAQPLDTPAPPAPAAGAGASDVGDPATKWKGLLQPAAAEDFTLDRLDELLAKVGLLNDAASRTPTDDFSGSALAGIIKALRERKYLKRINTAKVAALLADRYGRDVANPNTIVRKYDPLPASAHAVYTCALAFLPAP